MKAKNDASRLRADNRDLRGEIETLEEPNPSTLRQFVSVPLINASGFGGSFLYVQLQKMGMAPSKVAVDGIVGALGQLGLAFAHGPVASVARDVADGVTAGAAGRVGSHAAMETVETEQGPAWLKPGQGK